MLKLSKVGLIKFQSRCAQYASTSYTPQFDVNRLRPVKIKKARKDLDKEDDFRLGQNSFCDFTVTRCVSGVGGDGCISMLSAYKREFLGPDGGNGGCGAHVIFKCDLTKTSLSHIESNYFGLRGRRGQPKYKHAYNQPNLDIPVPKGTVIYRIGEPAVVKKDDDVTNLIENSNKYTENNIHELIVCDDPKQKVTKVNEILDADDVFIAARGGEGGKGNKYFATSTLTTPRIAEEGGDAEMASFALELKLLAHTALVGYPNAGKSTLLRAISRARPKVAAYPFTTRRPHIGVVQYNDFDSLSVADIPGLVPPHLEPHAASAMGLGFLRHVERCPCLTFVLDPLEADLHEQYQAMRTQLANYNSDIITTHRPTIILVNKCDTFANERKMNEAIARLRQASNVPEHVFIIGISGRFNRNTSEYLIRLKLMLSDMDETDWLRRTKITLPHCI